MTDLVAAARAVIAAWDVIEEVRSGGYTTEERIELIRPHRDEFVRRLEVLREATEAAEVAG